MTLFDDFLGRINQKFADDSDSMPMSAYVEANTHLRKKPFSFDGYEFQRQIVDDLHLNMSVIKCSQIGLTEVQIRKFFCFLKRTSSINGIFSLPNDEMYKRVSQTRIKPIVDEELVFNQHTPSKKPVRSMSLYQVDDSFGFITGGKEGDATSINADIMFNDEVDLTDQEILALYGSRLQGSDIRMRQGFSTPTFEGYGIDSAYKASDQHEYLCRCDCGHWNLPVFTPRFMHIPGLPSDLNDLTEIDPDIAAKLDLANSYVMCEHCAKPLDLGNPNKREWVPRHPGRIGRGYWVRPFATPRLSVEYIVKELLEYKRKNSMRRWYNTVLGQPYNDANARLSLTEIEAVMKGEGKVHVSSDTPVAVGIDVGQTCHVVLAALGHVVPVVFDWLQVPSDDLKETLADLRKQYRIVAGGMDLNPYAPLAREIRDESKGIIMPVEYATSLSAAPISLVKDEMENITHVRSNRTQIIDAVVNDIRKHRLELAGYGNKKVIITTHLQDMVRVEEPEQPAKWVKLTGDDHFFHALGYMKHSLRIHDFIASQEEKDERQMSMLLGLISTVQQNEAQLGVRQRMKTPSVLGLG
ncbi:phage terminase large subunit family protein [Mesorhizobium sp. WSM2239]|uniref:Phage terminase large subunit family protein n=2 Tax=unclassified Mesorhizobium TaxID=325217 RepID=A0AAU8DEF1_9HYPH